MVVAAGACQTIIGHDSRQAIFIKKKKKCSPILAVWSRLIVLVYCWKDIKQ